MSGTAGIVGSDFASARYVDAWRDDQLQEGSG